jgi:hypothetical protein
LPACSAGPSGFWQPGTKLRSIAAATALNANLCIVFIGMPLSKNGYRELALRGQGIPVTSELLVGRLLGAPGTHYFDFDAAVGL